MKMADGGFRPAYNCQIVTAGGGQIVVAVQVHTVGSDRGLMRPMLKRLTGLYGGCPKRHLVDGGFNKNGGGSRDQGVRPSCQQQTPYAPRSGDGPGVAAWRRRMKSSHGKAVYKRRASGECINARFRNWGLRQFAARGRDKVNTVLHWFALANNILAGHRLRLTAAY